MKPTYDQLHAFYRAVAGLTLSHEVINDSAVVYPSDLSNELEKVDPEWYKAESNG